MKFFEMTEEELEINRRAMSAWDAFWLEVTPKFFEWLRWAITLGAVQYAAQKTHSIALYCILVFGYFALQQYYYAYFTKFEISKHYFFNSSRKKRSVAVFLSLLLGLSTFWLVRFSANAVTSAQT